MRTYQGVTIGFRVRTQNIPGDGSSLLWRGFYPNATGLPTAKP